MKKEIITITAALIISITFLCGCVEESLPVDNPDTVYVDDNAGANFSKIQDAIDYVENGSTIIVNKGIYFETLTINKPINLIGESKENTIIQFKNKENNSVIDSVITINSDTCTINGFKITSENNILDDKMWGINIKSSNNIVSDNIIMYTNRGIYLDDNSNNNNIYDNSISQVKKAIFSASSENKITNNIISNAEQGIFLDRFTINNNITFNSISNIDGGIVLEDSDSNYISNNYVSSSNIYGIFLSTSFSNIISYNILSENYYGLRILGSNSKNNEIFGNVFSNNTRGLLCCCSANNNLIYYNNFKQNSEYSANDEVENIWNNESIGNYWDDYIDKYPNANQTNGIWDIPYSIPKLDSEDRFPLVNPIDI
jgi:parallel beta-helix repeat protein